MGLCKTSNFSIFTFINASDLKFCPRSYSSCVYLMMRFRGSNENICKMMMSHFRTLLHIAWCCHFNQTNYCRLTAHVKYSALYIQQSQGVLSFLSVHSILAPTWTLACIAGCLRWFEKKRGRGGVGGKEGKRQLSFPFFPPCPPPLPRFFTLSRIYVEHQLCRLHGPRPEQHVVCPLWFLSVLSLIHPLQRTLLEC